MDTLGHGHSDNPPGGYRVDPNGIRVPDFTIEDYARSVVNFLEVRGINQTHIIGHGAGAPKR